MKLFNVYHESHWNLEVKHELLFTTPVKAEADINLKMVFSKSLIEDWDRDPKLVKSLMINDTFDYDVNSDKFVAGVKATKLSEYCIVEDDEGNSDLFQILTSEV